MAKKITFIPVKTKSTVIIGTAKADAKVEYWSNPTEAEIAFGYGATHYRDFPLTDVLKKDGTIKKWVKDEQGRRWNYYRMLDWKTVKVVKQPIPTVYISNGVEKVVNLG